MTKFVAACVAVLVLTGVIVASEYEYRGGYYYQGDTPYIRTQVYVPGATYYSCGRQYAYAGTYSYQYTKAPVIYRDRPALAVPYTPDWRTAALKYAAARDDLQAYSNTLQALGLQGQSFEFQREYSRASYAQPSALGSYGSQGATVYGYQADRTFYGDTNLNLLYQSAARLTQNAQSLAGQAGSEFSDLTAQAGTNAARVAEILAKANAARTVLDGIRPEGVTRERVSGFRIGGASSNVNPPPVPPMPPADGGTFQQVATARCASCHTGAAAKGKFDIGSYPGLTPDQKAAVWGRLLTQDRDKMMPRNPDGGPGERLSAEELRLFLSN